MTTIIEKATIALDSFLEKVENDPQGSEARFHKELIEILDNQQGTGFTVQEYFNRFQEQYKHLS